MKKATRLPLFFIFSMAVLIGCSKSDDFTSSSISDYYPLQLGKYITYRLDSTVFVNFQTIQAVHKYQVRNIVDAQVTDAQGRLAYRIRQMIRDTAGLQPWADNATFLITPLANSLEVSENNLRFIKLQIPIRNDFSWRGNSYITDNFGGPLFFYTNWDYSYQDVDQPFTVPGTNQYFDTTATVFQRDEILPDPSIAFTEDSAYYERTYSKEVYAKHTGLVYQEFIHWEWQRPNRPTNPGKYIGYGITLKFLDRN